jgi:hypothetical protein
MVIPHTAIPISSIRPNDILLLLVLGCTTEVIFRSLRRNAKKHSSESSSQRQSLSQLRMEVNELKKKGPSTFVETSKLERKVLGLEKFLKEGEDLRKSNVAKMDKVLKRVGIFLNLVIFLVYYGIPLLTIDGLRIPIVNPNLVAGLEDSHGGGGLEDTVDVAHASMFMKGVMFPLSYVGIGMRISKIGLGEIKHCATGALVIFWSAQVMTEKVFECFEAITYR